MYILGISAFYHDSAACLLKDGEVIAAAQEERFTRKKPHTSPVFTESAQPPFLDRVRETFCQPARIQQGYAYNR